MPFYYDKTNILQCLYKELGRHRSDECVINLPLAIRVHRR